MFAMLPPALRNVIDYRAIGVAFVDLGTDILRGDLSANGR
jgi:hypothetical protein